MSDKRRKDSPLPEREMTKRDWEALHICLVLQQQIVLYGARTFDTFVDAMVEHRLAKQSSSSSERNEHNG